MLTTPVARLFTSSIGLALVSGASRINFGYPPGVTLTEEQKAEIRREQQEHERELRERVAGLESNSTWPGPELSQALNESVQFRPRDGSLDIPCWYQVDAKWYRQFGIPAGMFPYVLAHAGDRVVSLNATPKNPQPVKWIEYSQYIGKTDDRQFVEVDLFVEENGSLAIDFLGTRIEPYNVRVSRYAAGG